MDNKQLLAAVMSLPTPDLIEATSIDAPIGAGSYYRADTVVKLIHAAVERERKQIKKSNVDNVKTAKVWGCVYDDGKRLNVSPYTEQTRQDMIDFLRHSFEAEWDEIKSMGWRVVRCEISIYKK